MDSPTESAPVIRRHPRATPRTVPEPPPVDGARWIPLSRGVFALVDAVDFDYLNQWTWTAVVRPDGKTFYGRRWYRDASGKRAVMQLHHAVMRIDPPTQVDHKNRNTLDDRRNNLRLATDGQNSHNRVKLNSKYPYRGIRKDTNFWRAHLTANGKTYAVGMLLTAEDAARAYNRLALEHFGEFAALNDVPDPPISIASDSTLPESISEAA